MYLIRNGDIIGQGVVQSAGKLIKRTGLQIDEWRECRVGQPGPLRNRHSLRDWGISDFLTEYTNLDKTIYE